VSLLNVDGRSARIAALAGKYEIDHWTNPDQRQVGMSFARLAQEMILRIRNDEDGLVMALEKLLEAREEAMVAIAPAPRKEQTRQAAGGGQHPKPSAPRKGRSTVTVDRG
jgi:hypothetical protein